MPQNTKKTIAVIFGGRSPEHDVSVVSGLQALSAIDPDKYNAFPVYITPAGEWLVGDILRERKSYMLDKTARMQVNAVTLDVTAKGRPTLLPKNSKLFGKFKPIEFDIALPAFHGSIGEDGNMQGLLDTVRVPYAGMRTMASAITMDKVVAKYVMMAKGIPALPFAVLRRPTEGYLVEVQEIEAQLKEAEIKFPVCVKPVHLGSSIGVARAESAKELQACLPPIFEYDNAAIIEPFVENLVEYNVAVADFGDGIVTSAIERPKNNDELLDFKQKYLSGGDDKSGNKTGQKNLGQISQGMLSLTRELNPDIDPKMEENIRNWAAILYRSVEGSGAPRIDFIGNEKTGEIWMNEVNPIPGSFGYFLWEAAEEPILFTAFLSALLDDAVRQSKVLALPADPVPMDARLHRRPV